jgi:hypothetical protein
MADWSFFVRDERVGIEFRQSKMLFAIHIAESRSFEVGAAAAFCALSHDCTVSVTAPNGIRMLINPRGSLPYVGTCDVGLRFVVRVAGVTSLVELSFSPARAALAVYFENEKEFVGLCEKLSLMSIPIGTALETVIRDICWFASPAFFGAKQCHEQVIFRVINSARGGEDGVCRPLKILDIRAYSPFFMTTDLIRTINSFGPRVWTGLAPRPPEN